MPTQAQLPRGHKTLELVARQIISAHHLEDAPVRNNLKMQALPDSIQPANGCIHQLGEITLAVGFETGSDALTCIAIHEPDLHALKKERGNAIRIAMRLQRHGYLNLFTSALILPCPPPCATWLPACTNRRSDATMPRMKALECNKV